MCQFLKNVLLFKTMGVGKGKVKRMMSKRGALPAEFRIADERRFRHQDLSKNMDREWRILILYNPSEDVVRVQRYHARWGTNKLRATPPVEERSKEEWPTINLRSALAESREFIYQKTNKGYIRTTGQRDFFDSEEIDSKIVQLKDESSRPGTPATIDPAELHKVKF